MVKDIAVAVLLCKAAFVSLVTSLMTFSLLSYCLSSHLLHEEEEVMDIETGD